MDTDTFRKQGQNAIDFICNYRNNIADEDVSPGLKKQGGFLKELIPTEAPQNGENFDQILEDLQHKIMPGMVHWNHPNFYAYFPSGNSYPAVLGDMISSAIGCIGFSWASSPSMTELETIVLDWYAKALDLPKHFLTNEPNSRGGGVLQGSASECTLVSFLAARGRAIDHLRASDSNNNDVHDSHYLPRLVAYASKEAHSSVQKAAKMALVKLRILDTDEKGRLRGETLHKAIQEDLENDLEPFLVVATVGTTGTCAFDKLEEIGRVVGRVNQLHYKKMWFHVDGAYAGNSFILPEMRRFKQGLEWADSFNTNPNKLLLTSFDASAMWVRDVNALMKPLTVDAVYLEHNHQTTIDYRHYGISLSRRFRALKLWFVFRTYGIEGLRKYVRDRIELARYFKELLLKDERFELMNDVQLGLVCFRLKKFNPDRHSGLETLNQDLLANLNIMGNIHMIPTKFMNSYVLRFSVNYEFATREHIDFAWSQIQHFANTLIAPHEDKLKALAKKKTKIDRQLSMRLSFTRSVSREVYEQQQNNLTDGCTPIYVVETNDIMDDFDKAAKRNKLQRDNEINIDLIVDDVSN